MSTADLLASIVRHGYKKTNATTAVFRLRSVVDDDGEGNLRLRLPGIREAEEMIKHSVSASHSR
jgi:hypothetical protein